ncbi:MAG TPA: amidohydrolase family protein [Ilumatobacter sp.]|nr:amidohydrolase family protein [Ilumatobacter sp.]
MSDRSPGSPPRATWVESTPPVPIIDAFVRTGFDGRALDVPMPRESLRDQESLDAWPSTDVASYLFRHDDDYDDRIATANDLDRWLANLDRWNIDKAHVPMPLDTELADFDRIAPFGDRVSVSLRVDPHEGMVAIRRLSELAERYPFVRSVSLTPHAIYPFIPTNSREYYPIYAKCVELDLAAYVNVGFPGPRVPAWSQHPIHLDDVCWFFPELRVVMRHGGEPWVGECVKMLLRWPNLYYATTGFAPRYYPREIIDFMNSRGREKVLYAGYWPTLSYERILRELAALPLKEAVWPHFLRHNAERAFRL